MTDLLDWIEGHPATAAWVQAVGTIIALAIAIAVPWIQQWRTRVGERRFLRYALHTEVGMVAEQCFLELKSWLDAPPPPAYKNPRTARMPPLMTFKQMQAKLECLLVMKSFT
jgi:hypothetical protein